MLPTPEDKQAIASARAELNASYTTSNDNEPTHVLPSAAALARAQEKLITHLPSAGLGVPATIQHLQDDIVPALNANSRSTVYYGFVTGGATPVASLADNLVTAHDQNVQVHLPAESVATAVEDGALVQLCELLALDPACWAHRTLTTGATAGNVAGLALGREFVVAEATSAVQGTSAPAVSSVGELGLYAAMRAAGLDRIQILTTTPHASLSKAASVVGLGRAAVQDVGLPDAPHRFDWARLEAALKTPRTASIVAVSCGEVNAGRYSTDGRAGPATDMRALRQLCDLHGAWIHVDGAFGIFARLLDGVDRGAEGPYASLLAGTGDIHLADSIAGDCHKLLNVPYDCGFFLSRHPSLAPLVFQNPNAAYLSDSGAGGAAATIPSPLHIGLENSRRFRALPVYATLAAYGRAGYRAMLERQVTLARRIAVFLHAHPAYELLPARAPTAAEAEVVADIFIVVLFRARDARLNAELVRRINGGREIYVSGTAWEGRPAARFAVSNWRVDVQRDLARVKRVLEKAVAEEDVLAV